MGSDDLTPRQRAVRDALQRTPTRPDEWVTAAAVAEHVQTVNVAPTGIGQVLGALARQNLCQTKYTGTQRLYRPND